MSETRDKIDFKVKNVLSDQLDDQNLRSHYSSYTPQPPSIKTSHYHTTQVKILTRLRIIWPILMMGCLILYFR